MLALKRIVTVAVMVYLLLALLFLLFPAVRSSVAGWGSGITPAENERDFFYILSIIGAVVLALELVVENLDSSVLRRSVVKQDAKINELKAKLYDTHTSGAAVAATADAHHPSVSYPTAAAAAAAAEREPHPTTPPANPPTF